MQSESTLVLGLGNVLLRDDGAGVHALRRFKEEGSAREALAIEAGTDLLSVTHLLASARRIIAFDALLAGMEPGTVTVLALEDILDTGIQASLHELGLVAALKWVRDDKPAVTIIAVEPAIIEYGLELSPAVAAALPVMTAAARSLLADGRA